MYSKYISLASQEKLVSRSRSYKIHKYIKANADLMCKNFDTKTYIYKTQLQSNSCTKDIKNELTKRKHTQVLYGVKFRIIYMQKYIEYRYQWHHLLIIFIE